MNGELRTIISVTTDVTVYPKSDEVYATYLFSIPESVLKALAIEVLPNGTFLYVVIRDVFGNLIGNRRVELTSGPEVKKSDFADQLDKGQLYPGQKIRLEISPVA